MSFHLLREALSPTGLEPGRSWHPFHFSVAPDDKINVEVSRTESGTNPQIKPHVKLVYISWPFKAIWACELLSYLKLFELGFQSIAG